MYICNDVYPLLQILVTHISANRIPRTCTTSSAARKRTTHLVCGSCKRKLKHVQTCSSTRVCLTQHTSDTLRLFRELNCRPSYVWQLQVRPSMVDHCRQVSFRNILKRRKRLEHLRLKAFNRTSWCSPNDLSLYLGGVLFESKLGHRLCSLILPTFFSVSPGRCLPHQFQFVIHRNAT